MKTQSGRTRSGWLLLGIMAALGGCTEGTGPEDDEPQGLSFRFEGAAAGLHTSKGVAQLNADGLPTFGTWAVARPDSLGGLVIAGFQKTNGESGDLFILQFPNAQAREYTCTEHGIDSGCHGRIFLGVDATEPLAGGGVYTVTEGSATLTSIGPDRVRGSFTLTMRKFNDPDSRLTIDEGVIDVGYSNDVTMANGIGCLIRNLVEGRNQTCG